MPRKFHNTTVATLVSLVKKVMQRHKPYGPGLKRAFMNLVRSFSVGSKPSNAHSLSVLVTEDLLAEISYRFDSADDISSSFIKVMSLADEEVIAHYSHYRHFSLFVSMLVELLEMLEKGGDFYKKEWDLSFFSRFVSEYLIQHDENVSNTHLNHALELLISPGHYRLLSVNWLLLRLLAAGYVEVARGASGVAQGFVVPKSRRKNPQVGSTFTSGGRNTDRDMAEAVYNSETLSHMRGNRRSERSGLLFVLPERESLKCMLEDEVEAMMSLYSLVLFSKDVDEEYQISKDSFSDANPWTAWILQVCSALVGGIGFASLAFCMGSMVGSILEQISSKNTSATGDSAGSEKLLWDIISKSTAAPPELSNFSAIPASISVLLVMYLSMPITMFGGFASKWIASKIESRSGGRFVRPNLLSPIVVTQGSKLVMNTFLRGTAHMEHKATNAILGWTVKKLYLPAYLTEQPAKTTDFLNAAMAASPTNRHRRVTLSTKKCVIATLASLPFEYAAYAISNIEQLCATCSVTPVKAFGTLLALVVRSARIAALFGPSVYARRYTPDNYAYSSYFEQLLWIDGVKAIASPFVLTGFDYAIYPLASTVMLTLDSLIVCVPDILCSIKYDTLNKTASKLTALNAWFYRNNLSSQDMLKLAVIATLEKIPSTSKALLVHTLKKRIMKDTAQDLGMDLIVDNPEQEDEELEEELEQRSGVPHTSRTASYGSTAYERSTRSFDDERERFEEIELTDLQHHRSTPARKNARRAHTSKEPITHARGLPPRSTLSELKSQRAANRAQLEGASSSMKR